MSSAPAASSRSETIRQNDPASDISMSHPSSLDTVAAALNLKTQEDLVSSFAQRIVSARSVAQLVSLVPARVQDTTKRLLDEIVQAQVKYGMVSILLKEWRDALAKNDFKNILELKSLRPPSIQISKIASSRGVVDINFDEALKAARKGALERMIALKQQELEILGGTCDQDECATVLHTKWKAAAEEDGISVTTYALLTHQPSCLALVQSGISIGANTSSRITQTKIQKSETKKTAGVGAAGDLPKDLKSWKELTKEVIRSQKQSEQDKRRNQSGKGHRGAGPSKTKNQKTNKDGVGKKKNRQGKGGKRGTSSRKQQKKP
jgi:hypothetical protein